MATGLRTPAKNMDTDVTRTASIDLEGESANIGYSLLATEQRWFADVYTPAHAILTHDTPLPTGGRVGHAPGCMRSKVDGKREGEGQSWWFRRPSLH